MDGTIIQYKKKSNRDEQTNDVQILQRSKEAFSEAVKRYQGAFVHHLDRKKAHLAALVVHRGGGARIGYLQGNDKMDEAQTGGIALPNGFSMPFLFFNPDVE